MATQPIGDKQRKINAPLEHMLMTQCSFSDQEILVHYLYYYIATDKNKAMQSQPNRLYHIRLLEPLRFFCITHQTKEFSKCYDLS